LYVTEVLSEEKIKNCSVIEISMKSELYVTLNELNNTMKVSSINIQQIIEKLMYIACNTWSDIVFMIECLS